MVRELELAPIHPDPDPSSTDKRCRIRLKKVGDALLLGRLSEAPPGQEFNSGIDNMAVHRKHVRIEGEPPVLTALGAQPCIVINSAGRLKLTQGQSCVLTCADTYAPEPPYCTYGLHVPAACVLCVPGHACQPRACRTCRVPWHPRC